MEYTKVYKEFESKDKSGAAARSFYKTESEWFLTSLYEELMKPSARYIGGARASYDASRISSEEVAIVKVDTTRYVIRFVRNGDCAHIKEWYTWNKNDEFTKLYNRHPFVESLDVRFVELFKRFSDAFDVVRDNNG